MVVGEGKGLAYSAAAVLGDRFTLLAQTLWGVSLPPHQQDKSTTMLPALSTTSFQEVFTVPERQYPEGHCSPLHESPSTAPIGDGKLLEHYCRLHVENTLAVTVPRVVFVNLIDSEDKPKAVKRSELTRPPCRQVIHITEAKEVRRVDVTTTIT